MKHFFDIGANVGQTFSDYICGHDEYNGSTVWCFEPSPRHLLQLIECVKAYRGRYRVKICPFGLWDCDKILRIWEKDDRLGDSFQQRNGETQNIPRSYEIFVPVMSISKFIGYATEPGDEITLKIDAEGAEYPIFSDLLRSMPGSRIKRIMVEWHSPCPIAEFYEPRLTTEQRFRDLGLPLEQWI